MKILRILAGLVASLLTVWGLIALVHRLTHPPSENRFFFWYVLPYPVLIALTVVIIAACARNSRHGEARFSWFAVVLGTAASIGLTLVFSTGLFSIISWAYSGRIVAPTDTTVVAIDIAMSAACYIWAGAISASLSTARPLGHALAAGVVLLLLSCAMGLLLQPFVVSQLIVALLLPMPLAALGARLRQARMTAVHS
jgi:hypothetical protein